MWPEKVHGVEARAGFMEKVVFRWQEKCTAPRREQDFAKNVCWVKTAPRHPRPTPDKPKRAPREAKSRFESPKASRRERDFLKSGPER